MEKKNVYLLYSGDKWLSTDSLALMGVFSSTANAIDAVVEDAECNGNSDNIEDIIDELRTHCQTQGYDENWFIQECNLNEFGEVV